MLDLIPWRKRLEKDLFDFRREINPMFNRLFRDWPAIEQTTGEWSPTVDLSETSDSLIVHAEIPGISPKDIQISLTGDTLHIKGEKKQEKTDKEENFYRIERSYGSFFRSIELPFEIQQDKVEALYKDGILTIKMPKSETAKAKSIKIDVKPE